jgi:teichuronic acid biosynthesis glycosyltransferase TuaC
VRIAVLTTSFPRTADDPSGHFVRSSALALAAQGHEVHVIAPGGSPFAPAELQGSLVVHRAGGGSLFAWPGAVARFREAPWRIFASGVFGAGALARLGAVGRVDRLVAHWIVPCAFPLAGAVRAPLTVVAHGADVRLLLGVPRDVRQRVIATLLAREARFTFAAASLLDALARSLRPDLAARLGACSHVEPPAIDVPAVADRAAALRASLALAPGERLAVTVCRLVAPKRVELAIDAVHALRDRVRLVVVGDGPEQAALVKRARGDGAAASASASAFGATVTFMGALPRREALAWVAAADVLVHPSAVEAAPTVVREARALGVPVVACDAGDIAAWAHDDARIRVAPANAEGLARALAEALAEAPAEALAEAPEA